MSSTIIKATINKKKFARDLTFHRGVNSEMSITEAGEVLNIDPSSYARYESGKAFPRLSIYARICHWMGCSLDKYITVE